MNPAAKIPEQELIALEVMRHSLTNDALDENTRMEYQHIWDRAMEKITKEAPINRVVVLQDGTVEPIVPFGGLMDRIQWFPFPANPEDVLRLLILAVSDRLEVLSKEPAESYAIGRVCRETPSGHELWGVFVDDHETFCRTVNDFGNIYGGVGIVQRIFYITSEVLKEQVAAVVTHFLSTTEPPKLLGARMVKDFGSIRSYEVKCLGHYFEGKVTWKSCPEDRWDTVNKLLDPSWAGPFEDLTDLLCPPERWLRN